MDRKGFNYLINVGVGTENSEVISIGVGEKGIRFGEYGDKVVSTFHSHRKQRSSLQRQKEVQSFTAAVLHSDRRRPEAPVQSHVERAEPSGPTINYSGYNFQDL